MNNLERYREQIDRLDAVSLLGWSAETFTPGSIVLASSLGAEDQVLTHMIASEHLPIGVFTLDTGRLFQESYDLIHATRERLGIGIDLFFPQAEAVESMVRERGPNLFYDSVADRKRCCHVRKVEPLFRALAGKEIWITGQRREQSPTRAALSPLEWDETQGIYKLNPLCEWSHDQVWEYVRGNDVPYNLLHDRGFPSIGCAPCTRAVREGEDERSGRWWWESPDHKECGLHIAGDTTSSSPAPMAGMFGKLGPDSQD